jgi:hypothetical protein
LQLLINAIFDSPEDEEQRNAWSSILENYKPAMEILRKRSNYTPDGVNRFQDLIDDFFYMYPSEVGIERITNYIHMLSSGHIKYYMDIHKSLYKYSQQGWESLNAKYNHIFFYHTQRGGHFGKNTEVKEHSYIPSVMKAFQRELLWISGEAENYFYLAAAADNNNN